MAVSNAAAAERQRLWSPSPSLLLSLESISPLPATALSSLTTYLSTRKGTDSHGHRSQLPAPTRMAPVDRVTSTAIPRPAPGISYRLTSASQTNKSCQTPLFSPERARRPAQRASIGVNAQLPPSSYHLPRSLLPRSGSLLSDFEKAVDPSDCTFSTFPGLPKSQTTPALLSPYRDITSYSLLRPREPQLPRFNTCNDFTIRNSSFSLSPKVSTGAVKICFEDVKMSKSPSDNHMFRIKSPCPNIANNSSYSEHGLHHSGKISSLYATDGVAASTTELSKTFETVEIDPRFVFKYELSSYWAGRYVALLDRLRTRTFISPSSSKEVWIRKGSAWRRIARPKEGAEFARIEVRIEREAMSILRSFCQTKVAAESFEQFEYLIRKRHFDTIRQAGAAKSQPPTHATEKAKQLLKPQSAAVPDNPKIERRLLSDAIPQRMFRKPSSTVQQPKLEKSTTIASFSRPVFYIGSGVSPEDTGHGRPVQTRGQSMKHNFPSSERSVSIPPKSNIKPPRPPLRTPSNDLLNADQSKNFSHRDISKHPIVLVDGDNSREIVPTRSTESSPPLVTEDVAPNSTRRFRKSDSFKQFVDHGIKEIKSIGRRRLTVGAVDEQDTLVRDKTLMRASHRSVAHVDLTRLERMNRA